MKNITLSIDEDVLQEARKYAQLHHVSLNTLVRQLLEKTVLQQQSAWLEDVFMLMDKANAASDGDTWTRESLYRV